MFMRIWFPGLLKLRCMEQPGDVIHNGGSQRFSIWHLPLTFTTSYWRKSMIGTPVEWTVIR